MWAMAASSQVPDVDAAINRMGNTEQRPCRTGWGSWCLRRVAQGAWSSWGPRAGVSDLRPQLLQLRGLPFGVAQFHEQWLLSPSFVALPLNLPCLIMVNVTGILANSHTTSHTARPVTPNRPSHFIHHVGGVPTASSKPHVEAISWDVGTLALEPGLWLPGPALKQTQRLLCSFGHCSLD